MFQKAEEMLRRPNLVTMWLSVTIGTVIIGLGLVSILSGKDGIYMFVAGVDLVLSFIFYPFGILQFIFLSLIGELASEDATQLTALKVLGFVVAFRRLFDLMFLGRPLKVVKAPPMVWAFLFMLSLGVSVFTSRDIYASFTTPERGSSLLTYVQLLIMFFLIIDFMRGEREIKYLLLVLVLSGVVNAGFGIYQFQFESFARVKGTIGNANQFGIVQLVLLCLIMPSIGSLPSQGLSGALLLAIGLIIYSILLSLSRGAFIAAMGAGLYYFLFLKSSRLLHKVMVSGVVVTALWLAPEALYERIESTTIGLSGIHQSGEGSIPTRLLYLRAGIQMGLDHLVTGVGLGQFNHYLASYANLHTVRAGGAHNMYVSIFAEAGSIGIIAFLGFLVTSFVAARGCQRPGWSGTRFQMAFAAGVELGYVAFLIGGLSATLEYSKVLWILLALAVFVWAMGAQQGDASTRGSGG
jgi:O-antigen ligase